MQHNDPVPDGKKCSQCDKPLTWHSTGAKHHAPGDLDAEGLYQCPEGHELWSYSPTSKRWQRVNA
jgi:hypothetical protein